MLSTLRRHLTLPTALAVAALFFAVGGASFAADTAGSALKLITGKQVKDGSLTTKDVKDRSLLAKDFKAGQIPVGPQGPKGDAGPQGVHGERGERGASGPGAVKLAFEGVADSWTGPGGLAPEHPVADVGPWTISAACFNDETQVTVLVRVNGPGAAEITSINADNSMPSETSQFHVTLGDRREVAGTYAAPAKIGRVEATVHLHSGSSVTDVSVSAVADHTGSPGECSIYGSAVPTT